MTQKMYNVTLETYVRVGDPYLYPYHRFEKTEKDFGTFTRKASLKKKRSLVNKLLRGGFKRQRSGRFFKADTIPRCNYPHFVLPDSRVREKYCDIVIEDSNLKRFVEEMKVNPYSGLLSR